MAKTSKRAVRTVKKTARSAKPRQARGLARVVDAAAAELPDTRHLMQQLEEARETIRRLTERTTTAARTMSQSAQAKLSAAGETLSATAGTVADSATTAAKTAAHHADTLSTDIEHYARRNPIGALTAAVALGLFIGLLTRSKR